MRTPIASGTTQSVTAALASPAVIVILVLLFGATVYLFTQRYIRPATGYVLMIFFAIAVVWVGILMSRS